MFKRLRTKFLTYLLKESYDNGTTLALTEDEENNFTAVITETFQHSDRSKHNGYITVTITLKREVE